MTPDHPGTDVSRLRRGRLVTALVAIGVALMGWPGSAGAAPGGSRVQFDLHDHRIDEASGIGVGIRSPGVVYVQNDSGDSARFFAVDRHTGRTLAVYTVPGAVNIDWEDLAVARDARGVASIWLADTGDNNARRQDVRIYRVDEPAMSAGLGSVTQRTGRPDVWRLRYPGGPVNVEALAVAPGGAMTLATKSPIGDTVVFSVPSRPDAAAVRPVRRIGSFQVPTADGPFGGGSLLGLLVTGAAISPGGDRYVLRTYDHAYVWTIKSGDVAAALHIGPVRIALPAQPQGEGVTFDGTRLLIDSEGVGSPVWSVPLPTRTSPNIGTASTRTTSAVASAAQASTVPSAAPTARSLPTRSGSIRGGRTRSGPTRAADILGLVAVVALVGGAAVLVQTRRGTRG